MNWLSRHSAALQAGAALVTAVTAVLAVIGVLLQMQAADRTSQAQTARESYAAHLALAVSNPDFAAPADACALIASPKGAAYTAYVDHLLYAAEQMLATEPGWNDTFAEALAPHATLICSADTRDEMPAMTAMLTDYRAVLCPVTRPCTDEAELE